MVLLDLFTTKNISFSPISNNCETHVSWHTGWNSRLRWACWGVHENPNEDRGCLEIIQKKLALLFFAGTRVPDNFINQHITGRFLLHCFVASNAAYELTYVCVAQTDRQKKKTWDWRFNKSKVSYLLKPCGIGWHYKEQRFLFFYLLRVFSLGIFMTWPRGFASHRIPSW